MDLRQLGYVVAVADHRSFTQAAESMHVSQPSLSQAIRVLEAELGVELFHRTTRSVTTTAAGDALLGPARQALRDAATARAAVADVVGLEAGRLDLVCLPTLAVHPSAALIGRFRGAHPAVAVRVVEPEDADQVAERVRHGASEIGFTELPLTDPELSTHVLERQDFVALLPAESARSLPAHRLTVDTLARQPLVTTPLGTSTRRQVEEAFATAGLVANVAVETDHRESIAALVRAGAGVALLPRRLAEDAVSDDVVLRDITPPVHREVGIVHRSGALSPAAAAFLAIALDRRVLLARPRPRRR
jgi:LysR family carnitine catabolism transcriptional activator